MKTPENYFDHLKSKILKEVETEGREKKGDASGFLVPAGYFEMLKQSLGRRTRGRAPLRKLRIAVTSVAAGLILLLALNGIFDGNEQVGIEYWPAGLTETDVISIVFEWDELDEEFVLSRYSEAEIEALMITEFIPEETHYEYQY